MNAGQQQFYSFMVERAQDDKVEDVKALLNEGFSKQEDGTFNQEYAMDYIPRMIALLKEEYVEEVKAIMTQFGQNTPR